MTLRPLSVLFLTIVWVVLFESLTIGSVVSGLIVAVTVLYVTANAPDPGRGMLHPIATVRLLLFFLVKLVEASTIVAWEIITPGNSINEGIVAVPLRGVSDTVTTVVANAITLTPGTVVVEVHQAPTVLYVHVLHLSDIEAVRREVEHLEALAIRAFGTADARAALGDSGRRLFSVENGSQPATTPTSQEGTP
jgi:multicomponent Na+:H+ antiporter subunit E